MEPLRVLHGGRTLVVYAHHQFNRNVRFFMRHGLAPHKKVDYAIVKNNADWDASHPAQMSEKHLADSLVYWIQRNNLANDFGAYSEALRQIDTGNYDYFVFVNSSVRGPFISPGDNPEDHWTNKFTRKLTDHVAIVGSTINYNSGKPHVQSMIMCVDQRGLDVNRQEGVFLDKDRYVSKDQLIQNHEIRGSTSLLKRGYNMDCLVTGYQGKDWRKGVQHFLPHKPGHYDLWGNRRYYGHNLHPYETVFFKTNREYNPKYTIMPLLTEWYEHQEVLDAEDPQRLLVDKDTPVWHAADELMNESDYKDDEARYITDNVTPDINEWNGATQGWGVKEWVWVGATVLLGILAVVFMVLWLIR